MAWVNNQAEFIYIYVLKTVVFWKQLACYKYERRKKEFSNRKSDKKRSVLVLTRQRYVCINVGEDDLRKLQVDDWPDITQNQTRTHFVSQNKKS